MAGTKIDLYHGNILNKKWTLYGNGNAEFLDVIVDGDSIIELGKNKMDKQGVYLDDGTTYLGSDTLKVKCKNLTANSATIKDLSVEHGKISGKVSAAVLEVNGHSEITKAYIENLAVEKLNARSITATNVTIDGKNLKSEMDSLQKKINTINLALSSGWPGV